MLSAQDAGSLTGNVMRRKILLRFFMFGFAAVMLIMFCFAPALPERARPAASSVSLIIEPG